MSLNRRELFYIDALGPFLKRGRVLSLGLDLQKITRRHHDPEGAVFALVLEGLEPGIAIDRDGFGIAFRRCGREIPRRRRCFHVIGVGRGIENADRSRRRLVALALAIISMYV